MKLKARCDGQSYAGAPIDSEDGLRTVFHATQRDPHPVRGGGISQDEAEANARRLVACWNALRHLPIEQIEAMAPEAA